MNTQDVEFLNEYNRWANARMLDAASKLSSEQFTANLKSSHESVRDTLAHILAAEWIWLERWLGTSPNALLDPAQFPTVHSLRTRWSEVEKTYQSFVGTMSDESLETVIS